MNTKCEKLHNFMCINWDEMQKNESTKLKKKENHKGKAINFPCSLVFYIVVCVFTWTNFRIQISQNYINLWNLIQIRSRHNSLKGIFYMNEERMFISIFLNIYFCNKLFLYNFFVNSICRIIFKILR